jgi:CRP-like cAMP-binding protein
MQRKQVRCEDCEVNCLIKLCNSEYIARANDEKNQVLYGRRQYIFSEGMPVMGMYFIQSGKVKVVSSNIHGKQQVVRLAATGHILGHRGYGDEVYPVGALTLSDSRICFLNNAFLLEAFEANFAFLYKLMRFYSAELRKSELRSQYFAQMAVTEKVVFSLVYLYDTFSLQPDPERLILSREELASIAGTNADQVSRTLARLKKEQFIATEGRDIVIKDIGALRTKLSDYLTGTEPI